MPDLCESDDELESRRRQERARHLMLQCTADSFLSLDDDRVGGGALSGSLSGDDQDDDHSVTLYVSNFLLSSHSHFFRAILNQKVFAERRDEVPAIQVAEGMIPVCVELIKYLCAGCKEVRFVCTYVCHCGCDYFRIKMFDH